LVEKLNVLVSGKVSQGVYNNFKQEVIPKGAKFQTKGLMDIDYLNVNPNKWTTDKEKNDLIKILITIISSSTRRSWAFTTARSSWRL